MCVSMHRYVLSKRIRLFNFLILWKDIEVEGGRQWGMLPKRSSIHLSSDPPEDVLSNASSRALYPFRQLLGGRLQPNPTSEGRTEGTAGAL